MRALILRVSLLGLPAIAYGCATEPGRTYYDDLEGGDAGTMPDVSGGDDVVSPFDSAVEAGADGGLDADGSAPGEGGLPEAAGDAQGDAGATPDAPLDTGADAAPDSGPDAAAEAGCGATNTAQNCGACGTACGNLHVMSGGASCVSGACQYNCAAGYSNCSQAGSNATGCECHTPACCGSGCQTTHSTGLPSLSYYDCNPLATSSQTQQTLLNLALEACAAYAGSLADCASDLVCSRTTIGPYVCNGQNSGGTCTTCWSYGGTDVLKTESCSCPTGSNPPTIIGTWN